MWAGGGFNIRGGFKKRGGDYAGICPQVRGRASWQLRIAVCVSEVAS